MLIQTPPALVGDERQQLVQLRSYLYQMSEALNHGLTTLTVENFRGDMQQRLQSSASTEEVDESIHKAAATLKSMIIKTAKEINVSIDAITADLTGKYEAISDEFGKYTENAQANIEATAKGIVQSYKYDERLDALDNSAAGFSTYVTDTNAYIKTGLLYTDESNTPVYGVAIYQEDKKEVDGDETVTPPRLATFSANRLAFWQNDVEVAWISNGQWSTSSIVIRDKMEFERNWQVDQTNGFSIRWIGLG